jgi:transposase
MPIIKTDLNDTEGVVRIMRTGYCRAEHAKSFNAQRNRAFLDMLTQRVRMTKSMPNYIRDVLKTFGLLPGAMRGLRFDRRVG